MVGRSVGRRGVGRKFLLLFRTAPHGGFVQFFLSGTYTGLGTTCVKSETCYEKNHEKKFSGWWKMHF